MARKDSNKVVGSVNFPIDSPKYKSTNEGGMYVELWAVDKSGSWNAYNGGTILSTYSGSFIGTDKKANKDISREDGCQVFPLENKLFSDVYGVFSSHSLLACITLGSTNWSGYSTRSGYWRCKKSDLSRDGVAIYDRLYWLYNDIGKRNIELIITTWLDT